MVAISESVSLEKKGDIGLLVVDNPPVNALSWHVRTGLLEGMTQAGLDDQIKAVVVVCDGRTFIAGADIKEFGQEAKGAALGDVQDAMENSPKPVVAAIPRYRSGRGPRGGHVRSLSRRRAVSSIWTAGGQDRAASRSRRNSAATACCRGREGPRDVCHWRPHR